MSNNIFENPEYYRKKILNQKKLVKYNISEYGGKSLICVFFTSYCGVGCPFCFFKSPSPENKENIKTKFNTEGLEKFIEFANNANLGYLQISGGGEPFLEKKAILESIEKIKADRIILITSGSWAYNKDVAEKYLKEIEQAISRRKTPTRISIRLSVSEYHSIKLKQFPLVNLINLFHSKYKDNKNFTLQLKIFEGDKTLEKYLKSNFDNFKFEQFKKNISDDDYIIKVMPWKSRIMFEDGYSIIVSKSRVFEPTLKPNLNDIHSIQNTISVYNKDLKESQNFLPSVVYDSNGNKGLDWIIEYNGNVCTWQNRVQDNLLNIYEDNYETVINETFNDLITLSFIEKGSNYREKIISEISPKTVTLMKAVSIRDYAGTILYEDEKIRLYYNLRVLQDYIKEGRVVEESLSNLPPELIEVLSLSREKLIELYKESNYSVLSQELQKEHDFINFKDFLYLIKLNHFELNEKQIQEAIKHYNLLTNKNITSLNDINLSTNDINMDRRLTNRVMNIKQLKQFNENILSKKVFLFRHGETDWNVQNKIKGQLEELHTEFTKKGYEQINDLSRKLKENNIEVIFCSDLERTKITALIANRELNLPISFHKEIRGLNMGNFQGKTFKEFISDKFVSECFKNYDLKIPGGESINELNDRMFRFIMNVIKNTNYTNIAIITHSAAISNIKSYISGDTYIDIDQCTLQYENDTLSVIDYNVISKN